MKKILFTIMLLLFFVGTTIGQHNISYGVSVPTSCDEASPTISISSGSGVEGDVITIPSFSIPEKYLLLGAYFKELQLVATAFAGAEISIPKGSLKENISLDIDLTSAKCGSGFDNLQEALALTITVIGETSGGHKPFQYYNFENEKEAYIKFKAENIIPLLEKLEMSPKKIIGWFAKEGLYPDGKGIRAILSFDSDSNPVDLTFYLRHFSKIIIGTSTAVTDLQTIEELPSVYNLNQNYPNPFNPTTNISYSLPESGFTKLTVYNSIGVEVKTLVSETKSAGTYQITFDATELTSGIYFYDLTSNNFRSTKKMILIK
ncbi:MAG: T9SS type A sorting domain-containing protein [Melioribacteraceae bacterium]